MDKVNKDFNIPFYIFEEIIEYIELSAKGYCKCTKWENTQALINLAVVNDRLSKEQGEYLKKTFCREM